MAIGSVNSSNNNAYFTQAKKATNLSEQTPVPATAKDKALIPENATATNKQENTAKKQDEPENNYVKSFTYGALGIDKPSEVDKNEDSGYTAGAVLKAIGTIGSIIAIIV